MPAKRVSLILLALAALSAAPALADTIQLKDGRILSGIIHRGAGDAITITTDAGTVIASTMDQVVKVTLTNAVPPAKAADAEWARVALLVQNAGDLASIIDLHRKFLEKFPDQPISATVRTSEEEYEKLAREKGVKFRGRWMPGVQVEVTLRTWDEAARPAVNFYRAGKLHEALESAAQIAMADEQNPAALTIAGLAAYRLNNLSTAREYFKKLALADPSTPLPENNLAVIAAQQKNPAESLLHYIKALQSAPDNRLILDNIEEAFANFTGDKNSAAYAELLRQFDGAETRMEAEMAKKGLYRWGSTWATRDQFDRLAGYRHGVQSAMAQLDKNYRDSRILFTTLDAQIKQAADDYNNTLTEVNSLNSLIAAQTFGGDVVDAIIRRDNLMLALDAQRNRKLSLEAQRDQTALNFPNVFAAADKLKAALAFSDMTLYPGIQRIVQLGEDHNPPPPLPLPITKIPGFAPPTAPPAPLTIDQHLQQKAAQTYQQLATPLGLPMPATSPQPR